MIMDCFHLSQNNFLKFLEGLRRSEQIAISIKYVKKVYGKATMVGTRMTCYVSNTVPNAERSKSVADVYDP